jgi:hypothetical protein
MALQPLGKLLHLWHRLPADFKRFLKLSTPSAEFAVREIDEEQGRKNRDASESEFRNMMIIMSSSSQM